MPQKPGMVQMYVWALHSGGRRDPEVQSDPGLHETLSQKRKSFPCFCLKFINLAFPCKGECPSCRLFRKYIFLTVILCVLLFLLVCMSVHYLHIWCLQKLEASVRSSGTGILLQKVVSSWESNLDPLEIQTVPPLLLIFLNKTKSHCVDQTGLKPRSSTVAI